MVTQVFVDLSPAGVIVYPCFLDSFGFGEHNPGMVVFLLELDTEKTKHNDNLNDVKKQVLYDEAYEDRHLPPPSLLSISPSRPKPQSADSNLLLSQHKWHPTQTQYWLEPSKIPAKQRLSVLMPYEKQVHSSGGGVFIDSAEPSVTGYEHLTSVQILELLEHPEQQKCQLVEADVLKARFFASMSRRMRLFFDSHITHSAQMIGVPTLDGISTLKSVFGRFLLYPDGQAVHETKVADEHIHLLYYHHAPPHPSKELDVFYNDLYQIIKRVVDRTPHHTNPQTLILTIFDHLVQKWDGSQNPLALPLDDKGLLDVSKFLLHHLDERQKQPASKPSLGLFKNISELLYICLSQKFFSDHKLAVNPHDGRVNITAVLHLANKAHEHTQLLIKSTKEDVPKLLNPHRTHNSEFYEPENKQVVVSTPLAILMLGLVQSTTDYQHVIGTEANPMLIMTAALSKSTHHLQNTVFSLALRNNRSAASMIELSGLANLTILSRYGNTEVDFGRTVDTENSIYVSSLDRRVAHDSMFLKFHQKDNSRPYALYSIQDLSLYEASQAIVQVKADQFSQVKAGVFLTPYHNLDVDSDINQFLFWLSFYYGQVRVLKLSSELVGLPQACYMVAFFEPKGCTLDYHDSDNRIAKIPGFGNIVTVKNMEELMDRIYHESLFVLTSHIFQKQSTEVPTVTQATIDSVKHEEKVDQKPLVTHASKPQGNSSSLASLNSLDALESLEENEDTDDAKKEDDLSLSSMEDFHD